MISFPKVLFVFLSLGSAISSARDLTDTLKFKTALEATGLEANLAGLGLGRARLEAEAQPFAGLAADLAYDNRLSLDNGQNPGFLNALPSSAPAAFRIWQIGGQAGKSGNTTDYHELDRAFVSLRSEGINFCLGRQAVGWGRGELFSAVDIFSPFTPLEIDREWRRGVDAVQADLKLGDTSSLGLVSAWGSSWDESAQGIRLRGYLGEADAELLFAKRAEDWMYGLTGSLAVFGAELHAEAALFRTPGDVPDSGLFGNPDLIPKAVLGISNNFDLGSGLKATLEYHYSGFGASSAQSLASLLAAPSYLARYMRGDSQITLRQAGALVASYAFNVALSGSLELLQSLVDSSGLAAPSASWDVSDSLGLAFTAFLSYGAGSQGSLPQSQFGSVPLTMLLQVKFYD